VSEAVGEPVPVLDGDGDAGTSSRSRRSTFHSLRYPGAKRYFLGLILSMVGTWMQSTALGWLLKDDLNGGGKALGLLMVFQFVPTLVLSAWAGSIADRTDKRRLMFVTQVAMGSSALLLGVLTLLDRVSIPLVYALAFVGGIATAFDTPVRRALIGDFVPKESLANAMSLNTSVMTSSRVIGAALGGILTKHVGAGWCFMANGLSYAFMLIALTGLRSRAHATIASRDDGGVREGIAHVWRTPALRIAMFCTLIVSTFVYNYGVTFPLLTKDVFRRDADVLGWLLAVAGLGSFGGSLVSARMQRPRLYVLLASAIGMGVSTIGLGRAPSVAIALVVVLPVGFFGGLLMAQLSGLLISLSPATMRGRVLALQSVVFLGSTPIGSPIIGAISDQFGARWGVYVGGYAALFAGGVGLLMRASTMRVAARSQ
jgi:MFS family permease